MKKIVKRENNNSYVNRVRCMVKEGLLEPSINSPFDLFFYANQDKKLQSLFKSINKMNR